MPVLHPDPARVPPHLYSEQEVLRALSTLPPEAHVFVRVRLLDAETNKDRELDFLVVHPELGLVIVEVKGKGIEPKGDYWIRRAPDGRETILEETPGEQLLAQQYALLRFLQSEQMGFIPQITRVLALPALPIEDGVALGPDLPACRILTKAKLQKPYLALREAVSGGADWEKWRRTPEGKQHQVRSDVMEQLLEILTPSLLPPPTLVELLASEGRLQDERAQYLLDHLAQNFCRGRFQVSGGPGSGKSLLARQVTRIWTAEGRKVLVLAYNRALTYATQGMLNDLITEGRADVFTYHDLAVTLLSAVGRLPAQQDLSTYFNEQLPQALNAFLEMPEALGLKDGQALGPWRLNTIRDWWQDEKAEQVRFGTVHAFKGLEADVVIYLAPAYKHAEGPRLTYTAYSRARHRLIVLEKAIAKPAKAQATEPEVKKKALSAPALPQVHAISEGQRMNLISALTAAKGWKPRK